ncbi:uncharacterized protein LOC130662321 isoform X2 [Hydractinia symbiolongicarpus]|uniref:uncharacterized protein LOC130662321 isoform X2 n=1 Tax=Hydractinia symbiolongicarpus TaxID=13093 RepID=UPI002550AF52|nr:uncharacterized protein LOC130662321 isoform X2 [Hydractinia symbiolongicarpus]
MVAVKSLIVLLLLSTVVTTVYAASASKFFDRDDIQRRSRIARYHKQNDIKRTLTPNTPDVPDTIPLTPDMNVLTPDTPDTPDTKMKIPETRDTPSSKGFSVLSGDGSGESGESGYSEAESGKHIPILRLAAPFATVNSSQGSFNVLWKPTDVHKANISIKAADFLTETAAVDMPKIKANDKLIAEGSESNEYTTHLNNLKASASLTNNTEDMNSLLEDNVMSSFLDLYGRSHIPDGYAKHKFLHRRSKLRKEKFIKARPDTLGDSYKKQGLEVPYDDKEALGGEPIGNVGPDNGLEGLGSDMQGFPAGMGAGAEPLGAYDQRNGPPNYQREEETPEEGGPGFGGPVGFSKDPSERFSQGSDSQAGDFFESRQPVDMDNSPRNGFRGMPSFEQSHEAVVSMGPPPMSGFMNPPAAMAESMSNNLQAMDKANIQGDNEIAQLVRGRGGQNFQQDAPLDPSVPSSSEAGLMDKQNFEQGSEEYRNFKKSSPYYGLENGLHADLSDAEQTKGEEKKHEGQVEKDEANFWKKYGDVHFDDISAVEQRLDRDNYKDIDRYNEEDMAKYRANRFVGIGPNRFYTRHMSEADENIGRREEENYFGTTITDRENQHHENGMEENGDSYPDRQSQNVMRFIGQPVNRQWSDNEDKSKVNDMIGNSMTRAEQENIRFS